MQKKMILLVSCFMCVSLIACGAKNEKTEVSPTGSSSTAITEQTSKSTEVTQPIQTTTAPPDTTEAAHPDKTEEAQPDKPEEASGEQSESRSDALTEQQALDAIKNYCFINNPDLKNMVDSVEYTVYWDAATNDNNEILLI